jgi:2-keto-3-deoxy-6-phosphogluconate aldolase
MAKNKLDHSPASRLADRLREDESLTADLTDQAARVLLDWGLAQIEAIAQQPDPQTALTDLRRVIKRISKQAGRSAPHQQLEHVQALVAQTITSQYLQISPSAAPACRDDASPPNMPCCPTLDKHDQIY